ncbi:hypothetical protein BDZ97DRAFT_1759772 [Flammula alnicola]|nr:hypothetical protein BDZ97DRAFT_1759772 [Flammula alnicola]
MSDTITIPLNDIERRARNHAILSTVGFLILLPIGVLVARYTRTLPYRWFWAHWIIQLVISAPVILAGWALGRKTTSAYGLGHFKDPHEKMGLALLILYLIQIVLGALLTSRNFRVSSEDIALRTVHYGLFTEWPLATGGLHQVPQSAKHAWLALLIVFWVLYALGLSLIPRQFKQEAEARKASGPPRRVPLR